VTHPKLDVPAHNTIAVTVHQAIKTKGIKSRQADKGVNHPANPCAHAAKDGRDKVKLEKTN